MAKIHIFNPLAGPVVYSNDGHILGGGEHREVDALDEHGKHCVDSGYLTIIDDEPEADKEAPAKATRRKTSPKDESGEDSGASEGPDGN